MLFAASVILLTAVPFGDAVLGTGALVGISPYLLLQWIVPVATETPELVVAFVLLTHGRGGQSVGGAARGRREPVHAGARHAPARVSRRRRRRARCRSPGASGSSCCSRSAWRSTPSPSLVTLRLSRGDAAIMLGAVRGAVPAARRRHPAGAGDRVPGDRDRRARARAPLACRRSCAALRRSPIDRRGAGARLEVAARSRRDRSRSTVTSCSRGTPLPAGREVDRLDVHERVADRDDPRRPEDRAAHGRFAEVARLAVDAAAAARLTSGLGEDPAGGLRRAERRAGRAAG